MAIFDDADRFGDEGAGYSEPHFPYLNRTGRTAGAQVRELIEDWFVQYPQEHQAELRARLRSSDDETFDGAFFELYLHQLLRRLGYAVEVHPAAPAGASGRPDFLARRGGAAGFYLEARVARDESAAEAARNARINRAYDALDRLESPDFFLDLEVDGTPATPVPARCLRAEVAAFLRDLNHDECVRALQSHGLGALPSATFAHEGWEITYTALPKEHTRGEPGVRPIGIRRPRRWERLDNVSALRTAVRRKASKYADLGLPYVIAVNAVGQRLEDRHIAEALFGTESIVMAGGVARPDRVADGAWNGPQGPQHRSNSAVFVVSWLSPWTVAKQGGRLYHHPWAHRPCLEEFSELPQAVPSKDRTHVQLRNGIAPHAIFGLPEDWPGD